MGKKSRRTARASTASTAVLDPADLADVGPREPCPCGSGKRFKQCHGKERGQDVFVARPFEGLPGECDLIAFREIVPAATATLTLTGEHKNRQLTVCTVLPMAMPGLVREDGSIWLGLQVHHSTGDPSRDLGHALTAAFETDPGNPVRIGDLLGDGPRLQDLVDTSATLEPVLHEGFDFWIADDTDDPTGEIAAGPTARLSSVDAAYWTQIGGRRYLRWVMPHAEDALLDGLARLHAAGRSGLGDGTRLIGSFRALGVLAPVWELPADVDAEAVEKPAAEFGTAAAEAMGSDARLTAEERAARAGLANRQLTIR
jgi:Family of unknown function (DUF5926)/SEC-C motif